VHFIILTDQQDTRSPYDSIICIHDEFTNFVLREIARNEMCGKKISSVIRHANSSHAPINIDTIFQRCGQIHVDILDWKSNTDYLMAQDWGRLSQFDQNRYKMARPGSFDDAKKKWEKYYKDLYEI